MLSIILYIFIAIGISYFIYIYWTKWSLIKRDDLFSVKIPLSNVKIRKIPRKFLQLLKRIKLRSFFRLFKLINSTNIKNLLIRLKIFFVLNIKKIITFAVSKKDKLKKEEKDQKKLIEENKKLDKDGLTNLTQKINFSSEEIKEEKQSKISWQREGKDKKYFSLKIKNLFIIISSLTKKVVKVLLIVGKKLKKVFFVSVKGVKKGTNKGFSKIKKLRENTKGKIKTKRIKVFLKELGSKIKIGKENQEDKQIEKRLNENKDSIIRSDMYLGELLRKTAHNQSKLEKHEDQKISKNKIDNIKKKNLPTHDQQKEVIRTKNNIISKKALQKIEDNLINQILEDSKNIEAYKKLGKFYYNQDQYEFARESFEAALKLGSGDQKIKDLLQDCKEKI